MITFITPPISVNRLYRGRRFLTKEGEDTKESMGWEAKSQWKKKPLEGEVRCRVTFYFKNGRIDIDNAIKAFLDCLTGIIWIDDTQIVELHIFKKIDAKNPRIELELL